jgi:acetylornithine aminotransferase
VIERDDLLANVRDVGRRLREGVLAIGSPLVSDVAGEGLLLGIRLTRPVAAAVTGAALDAGFVVNAVAPDVVRLAPPLVLTAEQADLFLSALPALLAGADPTTRTEQP